MASTNINYYQTQKDLQEIMHTSEQKRKQLEVQLQTYWQSDQKLAQLRTVKLQSYLRHISEDAQRSRQRNSRLLCDLDSMESRMAEIAARRHRLGELKEQYWAFIDRTYPQWVASTQNKLQEEQQQQQLKKQQQQQQQQLKQQQQQQHQLQQQQRRLQEEENRHAIVAQQQSMLQNQQLQQELFEREQSMQEQRRHQTLLAEENKIQRQKHQQQQKALNIEQEAHQRPESPEQQYQQQHKQQQRLMGSREEDDDSPPPLPHSPPPSITSLHKNGYGDVMPDREYVNIQDVYLGEQDRAPVQPPLPFVTVHMPNVSHMEGSGSHGRSDPAKRGDQQGSLAERDGSVQSVSFSESMEVPISQPVRSVTVQQRQPEPQKQTLGPMAPTSEDEISDLMDDIDLPSNKDTAPHTGGNTLPDQAPPTSQAHTVSTGRQDREGSDSHRSPHSVEPEMSVPSLLHLIKFLNDDICDALEVEGYYRSRNPDSALRKEIINKSKNKATLNGQDGQLVSMVLLEQLTPVVRHLPGACLLPDTLLKQDMDRLAATNVRSSLHRDAQPLWDKLLEHFVCLLRNHVMGSREMAYVFVPCLTHDNSLHQDKAVCLLERVIEELLDETETVPDTSSVTSPRSSQPGPAEIEAYKHLLSGTRPKWPAPTAEEHETDDNTYNADLENQFASNLSPRSPASTLKSGLGSGVTAHQKKLGRMISSDLDTDTELEIAPDAKKDDHEDDDFYDFYG